MTTAVTHNIARSITLYSYWQYLFLQPLLNNLYYKTEPKINDVCIIIMSTGTVNNVHIIIRFRGQ